MSAPSGGDAEPTSHAPLHGVVALVLAAGSGVRFGGGTKQLAEVDGLPLVAHAVATAHAAGVERVVVVVGHDQAAVAAAARRGGDAEVVVNPDHTLGQASSLRTGITVVAADDQATVAVVLLADQPGITPAAVRAVAAAVEGGRAAARARYLDGPGHPVAFSRPAWALLAEATGDVGARHLLEVLDVAQVAVEGPVPRDVDTLADLHAARDERDERDERGERDGRDGRDGRGL